MIGPQRLSYVLLANYMPNELGSIWTYFSETDMIISSSYPNNSFHLTKCQMSSGPNQKMQKLTKSVISYTIYETDERTEGNIL